MIVEAMNQAELTREVTRDLEKLRATTELRLVDEYIRERKRFKINRSKTYAKVYPVKTASKNTWLLYFGKKPSADKYKDIESVTVNYAVYYYASDGLSVISPNVTGFFNMYYGHFFKRYNERMNLNLNKPLDVVNHYFLTGGNNAVYSVVKNNDTEKIFGIAPQGILLGIRTNTKWLIHKTFITRDLTYSEQDERERKLMNSLKLDIVKAMLAADSDKASEKLRISSDIAAAISQCVA